MNQLPPVRDPLGSIEGSRFAGVEMALRRDALARAIWSVGGLARAIATRVWETLVVGALTATSITTGTLDATTSIETVDLTVTGTATLPGGGGVTYTVSGSAQALNTNGDTITIPADTTVVRVTTPGGITSINLPAGSNGQLLIVANESNASFSYDNADIVPSAGAFTHPAGTALYLIYNSSLGKWHRNAT